MPSNRADSGYSSYELVESFVKIGRLDPAFAASKSEFEASLKVLRYNEAELTDEKARLADENQRLTQEFNKLHGQMTKLSKQLVEKEAEGTELHNSVEAAQGLAAERLLERQLCQHRLTEIERSVFWRGTAGLRSVLTRTPRLRRFVRKAMKVAYWTVTLQLPRRFRLYRAAVRAQASSPGSDNATLRLGPDEARERSGVFNQGWYGLRRLEQHELYHGLSAAADEQSLSDQFHTEATARMAAAYGTDGHSHELDILRKIAPADIIRDAFAAALPTKVESSSSPSYAIVTPFFKHFDYFRTCAESVAQVIAADDTGDERRVEWIIVNDDPARSFDEVWSVVPDSIRNCTHILSDGQNKGIVARLNQACAAATAQWLVFLDCDDEIDSRTFSVLDHYIRQFRACRYISSGMVDVDDQGRILRWRRHEDPTGIFEHGMTVGHLKAVRRDLFNEMGGYQPQDAGCQDYGFALRAALREPLLCIPEYLYRYRWHSSSQSISGQAAQTNRAARVVRAFLSHFAERQWPEAHVPPQADYDSVTDLRAGLCLIRTQGTRLELLAETVTSVHSQQVPVMPCVIVHGPQELADEISRWLASRQLDAVVLAAGNPRRKRGYPLNVGLDFLIGNREKYDFFFFLDDDDIIYPYFSLRLMEFMRFSKLDVAVCDSSSRVPWEAAQPGHALKPISALVAGNFIPIHAYIVRTAFFADRNIRFDESMDYLEDWDFLVSLFANDAKFGILPDTLCEYRIIGDGNRQEKQNPAHYELCRARVMERASSAARRFGYARLIRDLVSFDFRESRPLSPPDLGHLIDMKRVYCSARSENQ